jgi:alpha-tubulin suppressor-like RCC1 family protein
MLVAASLLVYGCDSKEETNNGDGTPAGKGNGDAKSASVKATAISLGALTSCALMDDATVRCWGSNFDGQLGTGGEPFESAVPVQVDGLSGVDHLWASASYSWSGTMDNGNSDTVCAKLSETGAVRCWGYGKRSILGDGQSKNRTKHFLVGQLKGIHALTSESGTACGVMADKSVKCWGGGVFGQLGNGTKARDQPTPVAVTGITSAKDVACGQNHCCAILGDGTASCWGYNWETTPVPVKNLTDAVKIGAHSTDTCALTKDGSVHCWGYYKKTAAPKEGADENVVDFDIQGNLGCAAKKDGTVSCWGDNYWGQLGNGEQLPSYDKKDAVTVKGIKDATAVSVGKHHACALHKDGSVSCWGRNSRGQLGNGKLTDSSAPVKVVGLNDVELKPLASAPTALPTDGKGQDLAGKPEAGCPADTALKISIDGKSRDLKVRSAYADSSWSNTSWAGKSFDLYIGDHDLDPHRLGQVPRGGQHVVIFTLKGYTPKEEKGKKSWDAALADTGSYGQGNDIPRRVGAVTVANHKKGEWIRGDKSVVNVTHVGADWVCGEISFQDKKKTISGKFAARTTKKFRKK